MDRSKVRIGLITTGIIAGLTLILYLSVLIWSPPWALHGYFANSKNKNTIYRYGNNDLTEIYIGKHRTIFETKSFDMMMDGTFIEQLNLVDVNMNNTYTKLLITENELIIERHLATHASLAHHFPPPYDVISTKKIYNPITLWHIKWLDWTKD